MRLSESRQGAVLPQRVAKMFSPPSWGATVISRGPARFIFFTGKTRLMPALEVVRNLFANFFLIVIEYLVLNEIKQATAVDGVQSVANKWRPEETKGVPEMQGLEYLNKNLQSTISKKQN